MRYALRNKEKVEKHLGKDEFKKMLDSLDAVFKSRYKEGIEERLTYKDENVPYSWFNVPSIYEMEIIYSFYIIKTTYDVYNIAYRPNNK